MVVFSLRLLISLLAALTEPAYAMLNQQAPPDFAAVLNDSQHTRTKQASYQMSSIRRIALKEAALSYGARSALARRAYEITQILNQNQQLLDTIYNFTALLLAKNVMPPVLSSARSTLKQPEAGMLRVADAVYRIERQAQFVTVPAHWHDYLRNLCISPVIRNADVGSTLIRQGGMTPLQGLCRGSSIHDFRFPVEQPAHLLLPKNKAETTLWQQALLEGWELGKQQAEQIFQQSLARLERDYTGMILYRSLLAQRMISAPYVAEAKLGVTGSANVMQLNDRLLRITAKPTFSFNAAKWQPRSTLKEVPSQIGNSALRDRF